MLKVINLEKYDINRYALVIAVAKRARQIANEAEQKDIILTEKPVSLSILDFESGAYKIHIGK
jgi:DNA-directed RNA polymerase subunit omega